MLKIRAQTAEEVKRSFAPPGRRLVREEEMRPYPAEAVGDENAGAAGTFARSAGSWHTSRFAPLRAASSSADSGPS